MKGLVLSTLYATKKPLIIYFIVGIIAAIIMTFFKPNYERFHGSSIIGFIYCR